MAPSGIRFLASMGRADSNRPHLPERTWCLLSKVNETVQVCTYLSGSFPPVRYGSSNVGVVYTCALPFAGEDGS